MLHLSVSIFNASDGEVITDTVTVSKDSNIASLKRSLNYENLDEIKLFNEANLLKDDEKLEDCLEDGDELNAVVNDQEEKSFMADTKNYSTKKVLIRSQRKKFLNLNVGQKKALRVEISFLWGTFAVLREQDVLKNNESVYQGFKYNLPNDDGIQEIQITEKHVMKKMREDSSFVVLPPIGKPIEIKEEEFSKGKKKTFLVDNEGPEIYLLTGTKTSFNQYLLAPNSQNSLKFVESKRLKLLSGAEFHFGLCKKPVQTQLGPEYTAYMYDALQILSPQKIIIRNSEDGEGPNVVLIDDDGGENIQSHQDLPRKMFNTYDRKRFDDWLKLGTEVVSKGVKGAAALAGVS